MKTKVKTTNYLPLLRAMEEVRDFAMNFSVRTEDGEGKKRFFKISGIRIAYLNYHIAQVGMVNGACNLEGDVHLPVLPTSPQVLITLFYENQRKMVNLPQALTDQALKNPESMQSLLRSFLRGAIVELIELFYASKVSDNKGFAEDQTNPVALADEAFELPEFEAFLSRETHQSLLAFNRDCYLAEPVVSAEIGLLFKRKLWMVVDSWGTRVIDYQDSLTFSLSCVLYDKQKKLKVPYGLSRNYADETVLSSLLPKIRDEVQNWIFSLDAKVLQSGIYPLLFAPSAVGTLFHEALAAHMLSGNYIAHQLSTVFAKKIGKQIASDEFMACLRELEIWDCPRDPAMYANYRYDMEGVPAEDVCLIKKGVVKSYLHDRNSAAVLKMKNNGHALAGGFLNTAGEPVVCEPRISNLKILAYSELTLEDVQQQLLEHFGFYLWVESYAGEVNIETGTFELKVDRILKVEASGKQTWFTGGVLSSNLTDFLSAIQMVSNHYGYTQGMCGAYSGWVPTEEYAPAMMLYGVNWVPDANVFQDLEKIDYDPQKEKYIPASWEQKYSSFEIWSIFELWYHRVGVFLSSCLLFGKKRKKADFLRENQLFRLVFLYHRTARTRDLILFGIVYEYWFSLWSQVFWFFLWKKVKADEKIDFFLVFSGELFDKKLANADKKNIIPVLNFFISNRS